MALVMGLEDRLRGLDPLGGIRRQQRQAAERSLHGAAQPVVEAHGGRAVGYAGDRRAGRGIDDLAVGLGDVNLLGVGIGHQPAVLQRADDGKGERIARCRNHADGFLGIGEIVVGEFADGILERTRQRRKRESDDQKDGQRERAKPMESVGKHWTTPAEVGRRRRHRRLLRSFASARHDPIGSDHVAWLAWA